MTVHITLLFFLISGIFNAMRIGAVYKTNPPVMHALFGLHVLLAQ